MNDHDHVAGKQMLSKFKNQSSDDLRAPSGGSNLCVHPCGAKRPCTPTTSIDCEDAVFVTHTHVFERRALWYPAS